MTEAEINGRIYEAQEILSMSPADRAEKDERACAAMAALVSALEDCRDENLRFINIIKARSNAHLEDP